MNKPIIKKLIFLLAICFAHQINCSIEIIGHPQFLSFINHRQLISFKSKKIVQHLVEKTIAGKQRMPLKKMKTHPRYFTALTEEKERVKKEERIEKEREKHEFFLRCQQEEKYFQRCTALEKVCKENPDFTEQFLYSNDVIAEKAIANHLLFQKNSTSTIESMKPNSAISQGTCDSNPEEDYFNFNS